MFKMTLKNKQNSKPFKLLENVFQLSVCFIRVLIPDVDRELLWLMKNSALDCLYLVTLFPFLIPRIFPSPVLGRHTWYEVVTLYL